MNNNTQINTVILGASGYTGAELLRFLPHHPAINIVALTGESQAGLDIAQVYPHLINLQGTTPQTIAEVNFTNIDLVFCCLPHATTQEIIKSLPKHIKIVDLSADFRLEDADTYAKWYGHEHKAQDLQKQAVYGLTEHNREAITNARLVANPGCYPTSILLPLLPLFKEKALLTDSIIIDSKSGVSGAGRGAKRALNFSEISEGMSAYGVCSHRHIPEIEQELSKIANNEINITFTPHLIPMRRGMLSTIYVKSANKNATAIRNMLTSAYEDEFFVSVLAEGNMPSTHNVRGSNHCHIGVFDGRNKGDIILISVIDNLIKGASGQAIQNMNLMFNFDEKLSIAAGAVFP